MATSGTQELIGGPRDATTRGSLGRIVEDLQAGALGLERLGPEDLEIIEASDVNLEIIEAIQFENLLV